MRHQNSVFHQLLKHVPWHRFEASVAEHGADHRVRRLTTKTQLIALIYAQLSAAPSLRAIETALGSHRGRLYHLGGKPVSRSTLSDANAKRPAAVFGELFAQLLEHATPGLRRKTKDALRLIDATPLPLNRRSAEWATFSAQSIGAKAHIVYDPDADCPLYCQVTAARVNDITVAQAMPIEAGATYVFDLGYYDFDWWAKLDKADCRIVTRLKKNTRLREAEEQPCDDDDGILADRVGRLAKRISGGRRNPYTKPVREVVVQIDEKRHLRLLTNDMNSSARAIADLYKRRWAIELFFRWVKQTLKITRFLGTSENAVRIQVAVALITYLLLQLARATCRCTVSPLTFARLLKTNLMHRKSLDDLLGTPQPPTNDIRQMTLKLAHA